MSRPSLLNRNWIDRSFCRNGTTLIETLAVMMMASVVLGGVAVFLSGMWRSQQASDGYDSMLNSIVRVAAQFRDDVHRAVSVQLPAGDAQSRNAKFTALLPGGQNVEYQAEASGITRVLRVGDKVQYRELYMLPINAAASWEVVSSGGNVVGSLLIKRPLQAGSLDPTESRTLRIDAVAGIAPQSIAIAQSEK